MGSSQVTEGGVGLAEEKGVNTKKVRAKEQNACW